MRGPPTLHPLTRGCPLNHNSPPPSDCKWAQVPQEQGVRFHQILPYNVWLTYEEMWFHQIVPYYIPGGSVPQAWFHQILPYNVWLTYEEVWFHQIVPYIPGGALTQMWFHQTKPYIFTLSTDLIIMMHVLIIYLNEHGTFGLACKTFGLACKTFGLSCKIRGFNVSRFVRIRLWFNPSL